MFSFSNTNVNSNATDVANSGPSISSTAMGKVYGWFIGQLKILNPSSTTMELVSKYPHPVMCVIGCESTGKSSTIESICKVPIFPSDTGICTRCPIKVVLIPTEPRTPNYYELSFQGDKFVFRDNSLADLKTAISNIFAVVANDSNSSHGYIDDVITIVVQRPDVIRMDFVDLPGIVSYPPEAKAFTLSLSQKYIVDPACFILCVANATTPRLTSYEPIAHIIAAKACERSIIVLPMADKLSPRDFETHLLNRVTMASDELRGHPFTACCAVVNRSNVGDCSLAEQARREQSWFRENILKPMQQDIDNYQAIRTAQALTQCAAMQLTLDKASARMGIEMLLRVTNEKYEQHIKERWMPRTLNEISKDIANLTAQRDQLGVLPNKQNLQQFKDYYSQYIHSAVWTELVALLSQEFGALSEAELLQMPTAAEKWTLLQRKMHISAGALKAGGHKIMSRIDNEVSKQSQSHPTIPVSLKSRCNYSSRYDALPLKWGRFEAFYLPCMTATVSRILEEHVQPHFQLLYSHIHLERLSSKSSPAWNSLLTAFAPTVKSACVEALTLEEALVEDKATAVQRAELTRKIEVHQGVQRALQEKVLTISSQPKQRTKLNRKIDLRKGAQRAQQEKVFTMSNQY